ncbi:hypothetical protein WJ63_10385 [Burkholderia pyrrocinia]|nr:hypothetical protein WJ63_10385 [Burkholderia pyrrocinia]
MRVIGKGNKERFVPVSAACVDALRAHWRDRGQDFDALGASAPPGLPLIAPLVIPPTPCARAKFAPGGVDADDTTPSRAGGYSVRGARGLVRWAVAQLQPQVADLTEGERRQLARTSPHTFRCTFGTQAAASGMALDVALQLPGHPSLQ